MKYEFLLIGLGGFFGSITRHGLYLFFASRKWISFPWATLSINVLGCLLIGFLGAWGERGLSQHRSLVLMSTVGFLGAFTTFSAFGHETMTLLRLHQFHLGLANVLANVLLGLGAVFLGRWLGGGAI